MSRLQRAIERTTGILRLFYYRLLYPKMQVGRGVEIGRGVRIISGRNTSLTIGDRVVIEPNCLIHSSGTLEIGSDCFIGQGSVLVAAERIVIGKDALIAANVTIRDQAHGTDAVPYRLQGRTTAPILIGENVWLGAGAVVLKGVSIGKDCIVGANAVVTKSLPDRVRAVGVPASFEALG